MAAPTTTPDLLTQLRKSGLVAPTDIDSAVAAVPLGAGPRAVLDHLLEIDKLTPFQAERLAAGKYKGFVLGGYVILDKLGGGGMGQVFLAEHQNMRRLVALKVLSGARDGIAKERFLREARAAAALRHPNIVGVHDLRTDGPVYYLVMEFVEGLTLQQLVSRHGPVNWAAAADYGRQVADGLQHAHDAGLVHRDIKPANLLLDRGGLVRILDLGLVLTTDGTGSKLTGKVDKAILGTADYLAPEQAVNSSGVDARADVYSLGATLYFLLAGRPMFTEGRTAQKLMWQQLKTPTPIRELVPDVPPKLAAAVHRALEKKPADRFTSAAEMSAALAGVLYGRVPPPDPAVMPAPCRRRGAKAVSDAGGPSSGGAGSSGSGSGTGEHKPLAISTVASGLFEVPASLTASMSVSASLLTARSSLIEQPTAMSENPTPVQAVTPPARPVRLTPPVTIAPVKQTPLPETDVVPRVRLVTRADVSERPRKKVGPMIVAAVGAVLATAAAGWFVFGR